jgi:polyphosphate kinase
MEQQPNGFGVQETLQSSEEKHPKEHKKHKKHKKHKEPTIAASIEPSLISSEPPKLPKLSTKAYEIELVRLQTELVKMQYWIKHTGYRLVILFEGRDAAGKGGTIKRITEPLNPRGCRIVALGTPSDHEKTQWYFARRR